MPKLATRSTMPRPNDPDIIRRVAEAVRKGHPITTAGILAGLGDSVANYWWRTGCEQLEAGEEHGSHAPFARAVKRAQAEMLERCLVPINDQIEQGNWVPGMTLAERRFPQDFGRNQTVSIKQETLTVILTGTLPPGAEAELLRQRLARLEAPKLIEPPGGIQEEGQPPSPPTPTAPPSTQAPDSP